jgi:arylsulfatase A-like enzyme
MKRNPTRREFVEATVAGLAGMLAARGRTAVGAEPAAAGRKPNIIVILADDMGSSDVGFMGCRDIPTPNLDSIAKRGVRFTNGLVSHPFCSPTRAGLLTGRYQQRFGHENNPRYDPSDHKAGLPVSEITFPQLLKQAGYVTGIVGKWHLGAAPELHPLKRGFDEQFGFVGGGHDYFKANPAGETREYLIPIERNGQPVVEKEYLTDAFSREAAAFVRRHAARPFFLYLAPNAPHTPLQAPDKYLARFAKIEDPTRRSYAAMVSALDDGVGTLLATLRELKLENDTLLFFLSDNGGPTKFGPTNGILRGEKGSVCEGGIRVPFAVQWRGRLPEGEDYAQPVISLDIFASALAAAGAQLPTDRKIDGVDLLPHLLGAKAGPPHERLFWRTGGGTHHAVREGRWKLLKLGPADPMLYDLEADPRESANLAEKQPEVLKRLAAACAAWDKELVPPLFQSPAPSPPKKKVPERKK